MDIYANKTIMILGAGQLQIPIIEKAKEKGLKVIVVTPGKDEPGMRLADVIVPLDVRDEEGILAAARQYNIDGITTDQTDMPTKTAAYVAEQMGLPGIGYTMGCLFTNKYQQRLKCRELNIPTPAFALAHNVDEALAIFRELKGSVIVKPVDSQASYGVTKVDCLEDVAAAVEQAIAYSKQGAVILEQYIEGTEFPVDSYVKDGVCHLLAIGQYHPFAIDNVFSSYNTVWPANQPQDTLDLICRTNQKVVEGFGLPYGRTHGEYIVSDGKCYLIEIGARGGGSFFSSDDVRYTTGFCSEDYLINAALGLPTDNLPASEERHACCCTLFFYLPEGIVENTDSIPAVLALDYVKRNNLDQIHVGLKTRPIQDKGARYFLIITAENHAQLEQRVDEVRSRLVITTTTADGRLQFPIWK